MTTRAERHCPTCTCGRSICAICLHPVDMTRPGGVTTPDSGRAAHDVCVRYAAATSTKKAKS